MLYSECSVFIILQSICVCFSSYWKGYWIQQLPGAPEKHYFQWNKTESSRWNGDGSDAKGNFVLEPVNATTSNNLVSLRYVDGILK